MLYVRANMRVLGMLPGDREELADSVLVRGLIGRGFLTLLSETAPEPVQEPEPVEEPEADVGLEADDLTCDDCGASYSSPGWLARHVAREHQEPAAFALDPDDSATADALGED